VFQNFGTAYVVHLAQFSPLMSLNMLEYRLKEVGIGKNHGDSRFVA